MGASAAWGNFYRFNLTMRKGEFYKLFRIKFEKQVSEVQKKLKTIIWKNGKTIIFFKVKNKYLN